MSEKAKSTEDRTRRDDEAGKIRPFEREGLHAETKGRARGVKSERGGETKGKRNPRGVDAEKKV